MIPTYNYGEAHFVISNFCQNRRYSSDGVVVSMLDSHPVRIPLKSMLFLFKFCEIGNLLECHSRRFNKEIQTVTPLGFAPILTFALHNNLVFFANCMTKRHFPISIMTKSIKCQNTSRGIYSAQRAKDATTG